MPQSSPLDLEHIQITRTKRHADMQKCIMCPMDESMKESPWITEATYIFFSRASDTTQEMRQTLMLCPFHELTLLEKMVNNFAKRLERGEKANPKAVLPRKLEEEDDESGNAPDAATA